MKYFVYILQSLEDNKYYIGFTTNINNRLKAHNTGLNTSTRCRKPLKLVHLEEYKEKTKALKREHQIKSYKGGEAFKKLLKLH